MITSASSSIPIPDFEMALNPTITEHDFRFPRRPFDESTARGGGEGEVETSPGDLRMRELNLDMASVVPGNAARQDFLKSSLFPHLGNDLAESNETVEELQAKDPLGVQMWRFFKKTKQSLPRQDRVENMTWRMMHINLRKQQKQSRTRHDERTPVNGESHRPPISTNSTSTTIKRSSSSSSLRHTSSNSTAGIAIANSNTNTNANASAPSGIAQLRKATDQNVSQSDPMNLDDFIFPDNVALPAGLTPSLENGKQDAKKSAARNTPAAIPIKSRRASGQHFVPQSVPAPPHQRTQDEFGYVTRHHRKTSIDERRVSPELPLNESTP